MGRGFSCPATSAKQLKIFHQRQFFSLGNQRVMEELPIYE